MIDFYHGELKDILPANLKSPETLALSFAIGQAMRRLQDFSHRISLYAELEKVPEEVLDLMAVECNTQYYAQSLERQIKESLVGQTLVWYMHGGTPSVLQEFMDTILQGGSLEEWYEYGGEPYYFKAYVNVGEDDDVSISYEKRIREQIMLYKNARSWLEVMAFILTTFFQVNVDYESQLTLRSWYFPRANREFLYLDDTWLLDERYLLNGFSDPEPEEFYPARLRLIGNIEKDICLESSLIVEKDLWYLDDTWLLDDSKILDADIFEYEL